MFCPLGRQAFPLLFQIFPQEVLVYLIDTGSCMGLGEGRGGVGGGALLSTFKECAGLHSGLCNAALFVLTI